MRVQIVDPPAYTPPYDRSLCAALARAGAQVELVTSRFSHGSVPPADGYEVRESFYPRSARLAPGSWRRRLLRPAEHLAGMLRYRGAEAGPTDVAHFQWLSVPRVDSHLLPRGRPLVLTPHGLLRSDSLAAQPSFKRLLARIDAVVALSEYGAGLLRERAGIGSERVHVIPHGPLDYLTRLPDERPLPPELAAVEGPVVLYFGLIRPYKGVDVLLDAFRTVEGAELWVVGRPFGVDLAELTEAAGRCASTVRLLPRFVDDTEVPALFQRADLVVLPHREAEQSGVLFTALAFAKAMVMTDVGGFGEVARLGAGRLVPPEDSEALGGAISALLADPAERDRHAAAAAAAAAGPYSWEEIAARHLDLYRALAAAERPSPRL
jgi:glycosyltransferase involved in cell wall biosynthesis